MLITCWSAKGGSGCSVVAAGLALVLSSRVADDVLLVDLVGDQPAVLGLRRAVGAAAPPSGVGDWLAAGDAVDASALRRLEVEVRPGLSLLTVGSALPDRGDAERLLSALCEGAPAGVVGGRPVIFDCGLVGPPSSSLVVDVAGGAPTSLLVMRPCYLALRRAVDAPLRPSGVVLVDEPRRALDELDVEDALGVPVASVVRWSPEVARAVDAGLAGARLPRSLAGPLRRLVP